MKLLRFFLVVCLSLTTLFSSRADESVSIYVSDMIGINEGTELGDFPFDTKVYIGSGGGGGGEEEKTIAMFILPLNDTVVSGGATVLSNFTGFELKASTNNFTDLEEGGRPLYWALSYGMLYGNYNPDAMLVYACNGPTNTDCRAWSRFGHGSSGTPGNSSPRQVAVFVTRNMILPGRSSDWLSNKNDEIVWSYVRMSGSNYEQINGQNVWTVCTPIKWFKEMPKWAAEDDVFPDTDLETFVESLAR